MSACGFGSPFVDSVSAPVCSQGIPATRPDALLFDSPMHGVTPLLADPASSVSRRAGFGRNILWVTPYAEDERHAAGTYPYGTFNAEGLPQWTEADRPIESTDVVCWYTVGITRFVCLEDWPIMPVARGGFRLEPAGFFDRNPTLNIPPPQATCCASQGTADGCSCS